MTAGPRVLTRGHAGLQLAADCSVTSWHAHDPAIPQLVSPGSPGSGVGFREVEPHAAWSGDSARTVLSAACGLVEVRDRLVVAAEPVGRAAPGIALVRLVRCLQGPLELVHGTSLGGVSTRVRWQSLNRIAFGYLADWKITVDGGEVGGFDTEVTTRLRADIREWTALTIAVDGHLAADVAECRRLVLGVPAAGN